MTSTRSESVAVLSRALDQLGGLLSAVHPDQVDLATPCADWTVADLIDHVVADLTNFGQMMRGEQPDWTAPTPHVESGWADLFREGGDDLIRTWRELGDADVPISADMQTAEFGVHGWDLATAIGNPIADLDPEVAEQGLAFLQANLRDDQRGAAFAPPRPTPAGADPWQQIAAFAGRSA